MKTEREKYYETLHKAIELKSDIEELTPESRKRLLMELFQVSSMQEVMRLIQLMLNNSSIR